MAGDLQVNRLHVTMPSCTALLYNMQYGINNLFKTKVIRTMDK